MAELRGIVRTFLRALDSYDEIVVLERMGGTSEPRAHEIARLQAGKQFTRELDAQLSEDESNSAGGMFGEG